MVAFLLGSRNSRRRLSKTIGFGGFRYLMINQHLTEICGTSIDDHLGRSVRETVPQVAEQVEQIV